ncbi:hypothetical protein [Afipia sp. GAS231]|uniref:hypothetical protein n=1 Tax=Afipia sp. GAS231 TaxID=1882747 RepID=UPI0012FC3897|nr:hypothetical protein [Afipia sp. GAS231]
MARMTAEDFKVGIEEIQNEPDRSAGIVAATMLESSIEDAILLRLIPMSNTHREALFGGEAFFANFASKIELGFSLGLYGPRTKSELGYIRKIRNQFAHYAGRSFGHGEIAKLCKLITYYGPPTVDETPKEAREYYDKFPGIELRWRFLHAASHIGLQVLKEASEYSWQPPNPSLLG